jgi:dipeptidyl aminopeptidase/acylaminoacyl peptidase
MITMTRQLIIFHLCVLLGTAATSAQVTADDYKRAFSLSEKFRDAVPNATILPHWIGDSHTFWYVRQTADGEEYVVVDAEKKERSLMPDSMKTRLRDERRTPTGRGVYRYWGERDEQRTGDSVLSPDKKYTAFIRNSNVFVRERATGREKALSLDGADGEYYSARLRWSPDSRKIATLRIRPAEKRYIYLIESSPRDQLQPVLHKREYAKPGDALPFSVPHIFHVEEGHRIAPAPEQIAPQYEITRLEWDNDSRNLMFDFNRRGHQLYRVLELSAETGHLRTLIEETSDTYINYRQYFKHNLQNGHEIIWMSERDNWNHLYLIDRPSGRVKQQITRGEWVVREVIHIDEDQRTIYFTANGMFPDEDPYLLRYYRIQMDGRQLTCLTPDEGTHTAHFSKDHQYLTCKLEH